jgi:hypothetical protein
MLEKTLFDPGKIQRRFVKKKSAAERQPKNSSDSAFELQAIYRVINPFNSQLANFFTTL